MMKVDEENYEIQSIPVLLAQSKLSKQQILKYNLPLLLNEYQKQINDDMNLRESSNKLQSLATLYLKQHQYLKQDVEGLKNTLYNIEEQKKDQINEKADKKKHQKGHKEMQNYEAFSSPDSSFAIQDNARNILSDQKIQLSNQDSKYKINFLEPEKYEVEQSFGPLEFQVKNISEIQKRPLKEIIQERQNLNKQKQLNIQEIPQIVLSPPIVDQNSIVDERPLKTDKDEQPIESKIKKCALELFVKQIEENTHIAEPRKKREKKSKPVQFDEKINEELDTNYRTNVQYLTEQQMKIQNLKQRMQQTDLDNEFWNQKQGGLLNLIHQLEFDSQVKVLDFSELKNQQKIIEQPQKQNEEQSQFHMKFSEFEKFQPETQTKQDKSQPDIQVSSYDLIQKIEQKYGKGNQININQYFALREDPEKNNKSKAFYDLMVLSRLGAIKIEQQQIPNQFPELQLKI